MSDHWRGSGSLIGIPSIRETDSGGGGRAGDEGTGETATSRAQDKEQRTQPVCEDGGINGRSTRWGGNEWAEVVA